MSARLKALQEEAMAATKAARKLAETAQARNRKMTADEQRDYDSHMAKGRDLLDRIKNLKSDDEVIALSRLIDGAGANRAIDQKIWAIETAAKMTKKAGDLGVKAITSGSIDVATPISTGIVNIPDNPVSVVDLLINRETLSGNEYSYLRQTVKTNNAAPVADNATKPTSVYTWQEIDDRARVFAHLSEPIPLRFFEDHEVLIQVLRNEMYRGVHDAIDAQVLTGDGTGESVTGILETSGIADQAYTTDVFTTLRKALTGFQTRNEVANAWIFNPADYEAFDLAKDSEARFYGNTVDANVFGSLPRVVTTGIPAGTALLGDFEQARLLVRQDLQLDSDSGGDLFKKNQVVLRAEGRFGFGVLRPQAFTAVDLTA